MCCFWNETLYFLFWFSTCRFRNIGNQDTRVPPYTMAWFFFSFLIYFIRCIQNYMTLKPLIWWKILELFFPCKAKTKYWMVTERSLNTTWNPDFSWKFREHSVVIQKCFSRLKGELLSGGCCACYSHFNLWLQITIWLKNYEAYYLNIFHRIVYTRVPTWYKVYKCI